jgi:DNA replication protein DnaC
MDNKDSVIQEIPPIGCDKCDGYGNIITPTGVKPCECKIRANIAENLIAAQIPPMYTQKSFETFETNNNYQKSVFENAKKFVSEYQPNNNGLLFLGPAGTGKTHLAVGVLKELIRNGHIGLFYNVIKLLDDIRNSYSKEDGSEQWELLDMIYNSDILVLDDLGAQRVTGWVSDRLYAIINHRYDFRKTTIVTTNQDIPEIKENIGIRIYSRLAEMCGFVYFKGKDYRIENMEKRIESRLRKIEEENRNEKS